MSSEEPVLSLKQCVAPTPHAAEAYFLFSPLQIMENSWETSVNPDSSSHKALKGQYSPSPSIKELSGDRPGSSAALGRLSFSPSQYLLSPEEGANLHPLP